MIYRLLCCLLNSTGSLFARSGKTGDRRSRSGPPKNPVVALIALHGFTQVKVIQYSQYKAALFPVEHR